MPALAAVVSAVPFTSEATPPVPSREGQAPLRVLTRVPAWETGRELGSPCPFFCCKRPVSHVRLPSLGTSSRWTGSPRSPPPGPQRPLCWVLVLE